MFFLFRNVEDNSINLSLLQFPGKTFTQSAQHRDPLQEAKPAELNFNSRTVGEIVVLIMRLILNKVIYKLPGQTHPRRDGSP